MVAWIKKRFDVKWLFLVVPCLLIAGWAVAGVDDAPFTVTKGRVTEMGAMLDDTSTDTVDEGDVGIVRMSSSRVLLGAPTSTTGAVLYKTDDSAFNVASQQLYPLGFLADDASPDSVDEGDIGAARISLNRSLHVELQDGSGNERALDIDANGAAETVEVPLVWDSDNAANCAAITASSAQLTLDTGSDFFRCCAWGNSAYALTGANPTATTTVTTGFSFIIADGQCHELSTADAKIAVIGTSAAGNYCCISLESP